jgi:hypothetical protein
MNPKYNPNDYNALISRIDANLNTINARLTTIETGVTNNVVNVESRITKLEQFKYHFLGAIAAISFVVNYLSKKL